MAQDEINSYEADEAKAPRQKKYYLFSPRLSIEVPHPITNSAFTKTFTGLYEINAGMNVMFAQGLYVGATFKNAELTITPNKIPDYDASMQIYSFAVKGGSDFYVGDRNNMIFSAAISVGQNNSEFISMKTKFATEHPITSFKSSYMEPEISLFFLIEEDFGIGATISYSIIERNFDPYQLYLNEWASYNTNNTGSTQYLSFGFGFYYGFSKRTLRH